MPSEMIFEAVVTTLSPDGRTHVAPMGVRYRESLVILKPFKPSTTLDNILATGCAVERKDEDTVAWCAPGTTRSVRKTTQEPFK